LTPITGVKIFNKMPDGFSSTSEHSLAHISGSQTKPVRVTWSTLRRERGLPEEDPMTGEEIAEEIRLRLEKEKE